MSFPSHRGDAIGNLAAGRTAKASSSELFLLYPASKAVADCGGLRPGAGESLKPGEGASSSPGGHDVNIV
ncbi:hypothetical protein AB0D67_26855 [Streptosporangium sp. NPDC048047]|uniref:hypothetical protein n=1 Tax=Streptosporangium sp. NPDC048047 TaxID=3155748 RepID=UPI003420EA22